MGYFSERLATTTSAHLIEWRLRGVSSVEGTIYETTDPEYRDGDKYILKDVILRHYNYAEGYWPDHFIATTQTGKHFFLAAKDQVNDTSVE